MNVIIGKEDHKMHKKRHKKKRAETLFLLLICVFIF